MEIPCFWKWGISEVLYGINNVFLNKLNKIEEFLRKMFLLCGLIRIVIIKKKKREKKCF